MHWELEILTEQISLQLCMTNVSDSLGFLSLLFKIGLFCDAIFNYLILKKKSINVTEKAVQKK